ARTRSSSGKAPPVRPPRVRRVRAPARQAGRLTLTWQVLAAQTRFRQPGPRSTARRRGPQKGRRSTSTFPLSDQAESIPENLRTLAGWRTNAQAATVRAGGPGGRASVGDVLRAAIRSCFADAS